MCDSTPSEVTYTAGIPKEYKTANQKTLNAMLAGLGKGATQYGGQLSAPQDQLSLQAANIMSQLMGNQSYRPFQRPVMTGGGGGIGGTTPSIPGGGGGPRNPGPPPDGTKPPGYTDPGLPPGGGGDPGDPWAPPKGPGPCFAAGTQILMADGYMKDIEDIEVGDEVMSRDVVRGVLHPAEVTEVLVHAPSEAPRLMVVNGVTIVTPEHSVYLNGFWRPIKDARLYDKLTGPTGNDVVIYNLDAVDGGETTYNFHTDSESHNYFADGFLAHNAIPKQPYGMGSPQGYNTMSSPLFQYLMSRQGR